MLGNNTIKQLQNYFSRQPVNKVWLFGSYARGDEDKDSDIDLLVSFDANSKVSLFTMGGIYMDIRQLLGKEVDLIEEGTLENYAEQTAKQDRKLIYERTN